MNKGQFKKGNIPYNKGIKRGSTSPTTEFKGGHCPHNFKGVGVPCVVGSRREVLVTTDEAKEATTRGRRYVTKRRTSYARYLWTEANGLIPKGMVVYNNGDREDIKLHNLELITRGELVKRNNNR